MTHLNSFSHPIICFTVLPDTMTMPAVLAFCLLWCSLCSLGFGGSGGARPPALLRSEVEVLRTIAEKIGFKRWDFNVDPCSGNGNWGPPPEVDVAGFDTGVECDCSFRNGTRCHVVTMHIKGQSLTGELPVEFNRLSYLRQLDLSRNLFTGKIPDEWSVMQLENLSVMGNRLSGTFPNVLTRITTLAVLSIEGNRFNGSLPPEIGNLVNIKKLVLSANNFSGELPIELAKLTDLIDLRISGNNFSGKIPDSITRLTRLEKLHMQGCSLEGPIPSGISYLTNLTDLRITDLKGDGSSFPDLSKMDRIKHLILRNCSIYGSIPSYVGYMKRLQHLDLSFNRLTGEIPASFVNLGLGHLDFMFLTANILTGPVPEWILKRNKNADISYNNFTFQDSGPHQCLQGSINAVESYSPTADNITTVQPCLKRNFPCPSGTKYQYSLHINCGGSETTINGNKYQADKEERGASMLYLASNWAFSSTGNFMDNNEDADNYIATTTSNLSFPNSELYMNARLSPLSLTFYGLCMMNGSYTIQLHFAEIIFKNDNTFSSLGERVFDIFIQGKLVMKDFNIEVAAGGVARPVIKTFTTLVAHNTLKIQFYWAGKGTTGIPTRGVYGPLVSAISITPNFMPPRDSSSKNRAYIIIGASILAIFFLLTILGICCGIASRVHKIIYSADLESLHVQTGSFTLHQINAATGNFDVANKIGEGGFGSVYKGYLSDGTIIAVKKLSARSRQGTREFINEIGMISALQHPNLVKLYGCCIEANQLILVYEYMENNCLARALYAGRDPASRLDIDWPTRRKICLGIAKGLAYLHEESRLKIVHRDIKPSNVLLDKDLNAKISDFGLAKLFEEGHSHISTRVAGTIGYMAPEYALRGHLSKKVDVYSFGVVAMEVVCGKTNSNCLPVRTDDFVFIHDWACYLHEKGKLLDMVDPNLGSNYSKEEAVLMLQVSLLCTSASPNHRPTMSEVVSFLEGFTPIEPLLSGLSISPSMILSNGMIRRNFHNYSDITAVVPANTTITGPPAWNSGEVLSMDTSSNDVHLANNSGHDVLTRNNSGNDISRKNTGDDIGKNFIGPSSQPVT